MPEGDGVTQPVGASDGTSEGAAACSVDVRLTMLARTPLFRGLEDHEIEGVNARCRARAVQPGELVFRWGEPAESLFVIATGQVKLMEHASDGRLVVLDLFGPGEFFGSAPALGDDAYTYDAQAVTAGCVLALSAETFERILHDVPLVALNALALTSQRLRDAQQTVHALSTLAVEAQVAATLLRLAAKFGEVGPAGTRLEAALTQVDLAAMSGTTPESVNRVLSAFRRRGLVDSGRGWFVLKDRAALEALKDSH